MNQGFKINLMKKVKKYLIKNMILSFLLKVIVNIIHLIEKC